MLKVLIIVLAVMFMAVIAHAQVLDNTALVVDNSAPDIWTWITQKNNVEVSAHYFLNRDLKSTTGASLAYEFLQLANDIIGIRLEAIAPVNAKDESAPDKLAGLGASLKLNHAINALKGSTIIPDNIQIGMAVSIDVTQGLVWKEMARPYVSMFLVGIKF